MEEKEELNLEEEFDEDSSEDITDDEFEYDDDGNIIIPDVIDEDGEIEEDIADEEQDEKEEVEESEDKKDSEESDEVVEPATEPDEKDTKIAKLEKELNAFKKQGKATLSKLGVETDDIMAGFEQLEAEADGLSLEEFKKN